MSNAAEPAPMPCPACGKPTVTVDLLARAYEVPVYSLELGTVWLGPWQPFDELELEVDSRAGCECGWESGPVQEYELGAP